MPYELTELKDGIGCEVHTDLNTLLSPGTGEKLRSVLINRGVLVIKGLHLTDDQQAALARSMGQLREEQGQAIFKITLDQKVNARADYLKGSFLWHIDGTHDDVPPFATMLSARVLSDQGGQTEFANSYLAWEELPDATKDRIADLRVVHSVETSMRRAGVEATDANVAYWRSMPDKVHNLVWTHRSGRKSLVIGCHASHIENMDEDEGRALLQELLTWATQPRFVYRHAWTPGDLLIWDNTGVLHRVEPYPLDSGRIMHRATLMGEEPFA